MVRRGGGDVLLDPVGQGREVRDIEGLGGHFVGAVLLDELIETFLAPTDGDDEDATCDHALGESLTDA